MQTGRLRYHQASCSPVLTVSPAVPVASSSALANAWNATRQHRCFTRDWYICSSFYSRLNRAWTTVMSSRCSPSTSATSASGDHTSFLIYAHLIAYLYLSSKVVLFLPCPLASVIVQRFEPQKPSLGTPIGLRVCISASSLACLSACVNAVLCLPEKANGARHHKPQSRSPSVATVCLLWNVDLAHSA